MKAMILAAGLGTRLKPFTNHHPKALVPVNGKPVLQRNIEYLQQYGIVELVVNVHHFAQQIIDTLHANQGWGSQVTISNEEDEVLETGGGLKKAIPFFNGEDPILVMNADILTDLNLTEMLAFHRYTQADASLATTHRNTTRCLLFNQHNQLVGWQNSATGELRGVDTAQPFFGKAFSGVQILSRRLFDHIPLSGKFSLIDLYLTVCNHQKILAYDHSNGRFADIGSPEKLSLAEQLFA